MSQTAEPIVYRRLPFESHIERIKRLDRSGVSRTKIIKRTGASAEDLDRAGVPYSKPGPESALVLPPPLAPGRRCWLDPVGLVTIVSPAFEAREWWVENRYGQEVSAKESELQPLGIGAK